MNECPSDNYSVVHVVSSLKMGGAERFTIDLSQVQKEDGLKVHILCLDSIHNVLVSEVKQKGILLTVSEKGSNRIHRITNIRRLFKNFNIIHIHSPSALAFLAPIVLTMNKVYIYTRHGIDPLKEFRWRLLHKVIQHRIHKATFVTKHGYTAFDNQHKWNKSKLMVIENGVYIPKLAEKSRTKVLRIGSVGRMVKLKGQSDLILALQALESQYEQKKAEVHFFGEGPEASNLESQCKNVLKEIQAFFHGAVLDREKIYNSIDVLVVTSRSEGLSLVILEAMARSIPVIATKVGGNESLVKDGETGILVPYQGVDEIAKALLLFFQDQNKIEKFGAAGKKFLEEHYSLENTHKAYLTCYKNATA